MKPNKFKPFPELMAPFKFNPGFDIKSKLRAYKEIKNNKYETTED